MDFQQQLNLLFDMIVAAALGGLIGLEREAANKPAGFRTHLLVAAGAALLLSLCEALVLHFADLTKNSLLQADPIRVVEAIILGVTFLGAGTIFRHKGEDYIEGLTTAASLLMVAAIGMGASLGLWVAATGATAFTLIVLFVSRYDRHQSE